MSYIFQSGYSFDNDLNFIFLCGSHFNKKSDVDKRKILKEKIKSQSEEYCPIILEENFSLKGSNKNYLGYDDIFLNDLSDIEILMSVFSKAIFIIQDSYSTSAELGSFAVNKHIRPKIGVICPDPNSVDEDKIGFFSNFSFFNDSHLYKSTKIIYSPDVIVHKVSKYRSEYYTYFHNNEIGENLWNQIKGFIEAHNTNTVFNIKRNKFKNSNEIENSIEYFINQENHLHVSVKLEYLPIQILSLFVDNSLKTLLRSEKELFEIVSIIEELYKKTLFNTVQHNEINALDYKELKILTNYYDLSLREAIAFCIYLLQAAEFIGLVKESDDSNYSIRKLVFKEKLNSFLKKHRDFLVEDKDSEFSEIKYE